MKMPSTRAQPTSQFQQLSLPLQGYLAHKKLPRPRTLQQAQAWGPPVLLRGGQLLMSEVPLPRQALRTSIKSQFLKILITFGDECPQNGSKYGSGIGFEGPGVVPHGDERAVIKKWGAYKKVQARFRPRRSG